MEKSYLVIVVAWGDGNPAGYRVEAIRTRTSLAAETVQAALAGMDGVRSVLVVED